MLSQKKETKEKATPFRLFPELFSLNGRQAETRFAQTAARRNPPLSLNNSGAAAGDWVVDARFCRVGKVFIAHAVQI
ncbi:hypothetical protein [Methylotenera sp.]|uniref:hypothetical protein n=1 Tax=Methylotenera sp. TaxID=2051956 RepID=UPI00248A056C|nr:hypothetical protein [Methylotenera sp.]MDI1300137.1 hypothetical protein [Methylotenera sp.]